MNATVAHVVTYPSIGQKHSDFSALAGYTKNLIDGFDKETRINHAVLSKIQKAKDRFGQENSFIDNEVLVEEIWTRGSLTFWWPIFQYLRKNKQIRVVHLQHEFNLFGGIISVAFIFWMLFLIRFILRRKVVATAHEVFSPKLINKNFMAANNLFLPIWFAKIAFYLYFQITFFLCVDKIIVHDGFFKNIFQNDYNLGYKTETIAHGVEDLSWISNKSDSRLALGLDPNKKVLMFFGFLAGYKGVELLIEGFKKLENRENYQLVIAGGKVKRVADNETYKNWLEKIQNDAKDLGILMPGFVKNEEIETYFRASDLLILPYLTPQSMSGIMALAVGFKQPFLASSSFKERVEDEWLFDLTPNALATKVTWFFENTEHEKEMINYLEVLKKERLWTVIATQTQEIYNQFLK